MGSRSEKTSNPLTLNAPSGGDHSNRKISVLLRLKFPFFPSMIYSWPVNWKKRGEGSDTGGLHNRCPLFFCWRR